MNETVGEMTVKKNTATFKVQKNKNMKEMKKETKKKRNKKRKGQHIFSILFQYFILFILFYFYLQSQRLIALRLRLTLSRNTSKLCRTKIIQYGIIVKIVNTV